MVDMIFKVGKFLFKLFQFLKILKTDLNIASKHCFFFHSVSISKITNTRSKKKGADRPVQLKT